jgi:hypothetical protein
VVLHQVQEELDALAVRLGRSLTIDSTSGDLIAYSPQRGDADAARISAILLRHVATEVREWEARHVVVDATEPTSIPANPEIGMSARLCMPLRRNGRNLGYLWMLESNSVLSMTELAVLQRATETMADLLDIPARSAVQPALLGREADRLIRRLFDEGHAEAYGQLAAAVPSLVDGVIRLVAAVATHPRGGGPRSLTSSEFSSMAGALTPALCAHPSYVGSHVATTHSLIVLHNRVERDEDDLLLDEIDEIVTRCLTAGSELTLGLSDPKRFGLRSARDARNQALAAAELAALDPALDRRSSWSALGPYRSLIGSNRLADDALTPLDEAGSSAPMLIETLETYLDLAGDVQRTAARLNLHRSSLYYRLHRIAGLLESDLSSGFVRLELHLALKNRRAARRTLG